MNIKYFYKNLSEQEKTMLENYSGQKLNKVEKYLSKVPAGEIEIMVKGERFPTKSAYLVTFVLTWPGTELMASEDDHTIAESVDLAMDKLLIQLQKLNEKK